MARKLTPEEFDKFINFMTYSSHCLADNDDVSKADIDALEAAGLIMYYDACYFISDTAVAALIAGRAAAAEDEHE